MATKTLERPASLAKACEVALQTIGTNKSTAEVRGFIESNWRDIKPSNPDHWPQHVTNARKRLGGEPAQRGRTSSAVVTSQTRKGNTPVAARKPVTKAPVSAGNAWAAVTRILEKFQESDEAESLAVAIGDCDPKEVSALLHEFSVMRTVHEPDAAMKAMEAAHGGFAA